MKVLKSGNTSPVKAEYKVFCGFVKDEKIPGCGASLVVSTDDIFRTHIMTPEGPGIMFQYMCPECFKCQIIPASTVAMEVAYPFKDEWLKKKRSSAVSELAILVAQRTDESLLDSIEEVKLEYFID